MLVSEIYLFLLVTGALVVLLFYKFFFRLLTPLFWLIDSIKKWYFKVTSLNKIKEQVFNQEDTVQEETKDEIQKNTQKLKHKLDRLFLQLEVFRQKGDLDAMEQKLNEILSIDENNLKALEMLSNLYINLGKEKKAFPLLKRLIQIDMENDNAIWNLAKIYLNL
jgi:tetratricopeptide (TPR) repeat protein